MDIEFVKYDFSFLNNSWVWLNDCEIKELTMTPDFTKQDQIKWFNFIEGKDDYFIRGIKCANIPIGAIGIKHIDHAIRTGEYFGYIGEKKYWGKGIGKIMMSFIKKTALDLNLDSLYLYVTRDNKHAIQLYIKNGFISEESANLDPLKMICTLNK